MRGLWRMPWAAGLLCSAPLLGLAAVLLLSAWRSYGEDRRHHPFPPRPSAVMCRTYLRRALVRLAGRLEGWAGPSGGPLETFALDVDPAGLEALSASATPDRRRVKAVLTTRAGSWPVTCRLRGDHYWHWSGGLQSWRIRLPEGERLDGCNEFNLINEKLHFPLVNPVSLDLAARSGLVAAPCRPVHVVVNGESRGVAMFTGQTDAALLRRAGLPPGTIYGSQRSSRAWGDASAWEAMDRDGPADARDMERFVAHVRTPDLKAFRAYCLRHLDLEAYATYVAVDAVLGCAHHARCMNQRYYSDPVRGRFVPLPWDYNYWGDLQGAVVEGCRGRPALARWWIGPAGLPADLPAGTLLRQWKRIPEFEWLRQRRIWELLQGPLAPGRVAGALDRARALAWADLARDPCKDGLSPLPDLNSSISPATGAGAQRAYLETRQVPFSRGRYLGEYLRRAELRYHAGVAGGRTLLRFRCGGVAACEVAALVLRGRGGPVRLWRDLDDDGRAGPGDPLAAEAVLEGGACRLPLAERLHPGLRDAPGGPWFAGEPLQDLVPAPLDYGFVLEAGEAEVIGVVSRNAVTGEPVEALRCVLPEGEASGSASLHPWRVPAPPAPSVVELGPGEVSLKGTTQIAETSALRIQPGTRLSFAPGAALVCRGPVTAEGTAEQPIRFVPGAGGAAWGGVALQGPRASGSRFAHCLWEGASGFEHDLIRYPAMVSVHDASGVSFTRCALLAGGEGVAALRLACAREAEVLGCRLRSGKGGGLHLLLSSARLRGTRMDGPGGPLLLADQSDADLEGCWLGGVPDALARAEQGARLRVSGSCLEDAAVGIEVLDGARLALEASRLSGVSTGCVLKRVSGPGGGELAADGNLLSRCDRFVRKDAASRAGIGAKRPPDDEAAWERIRAAAGSGAP